MHMLVKKFPGVDFFPGDGEESPPWMHGAMHEIKMNIRPVIHNEHALTHAASMHIFTCQAT